MIVLDTHALVWWVSDPARLSRPASRAIERAVAAQQALVSCITAWEITMLNQRGRLELAMDVADWLDRIQKLPYLQFVPIDTSIAIRSVLLPAPFHKDPADRIIVATALTTGARLVTMDEKLRSYAHVTTVW